jgi:chromatin remodeling complex protein RSC6
LHISPSYHILLEDKQNQQCKQLRSYLDFWSTKKKTLAMRITLDFNLQKILTLKMTMQWLHKMLMIFLIVKLTSSYFNNNNNTLF